MLGWALTFLVIALIAAALGFGGIAGASAGIAQILFYIFLVLLLISLVMHFAEALRVSLEHTVKERPALLSGRRPSTSGDGTSGWLLRGLDALRHLLLLRGLRRLGARHVRKLAPHTRLIVRMHLLEMRELPLGDLMRDTPHGFGAVEKQASLLAGIEQIEQRRDLLVVVIAVAVIVAIGVARDRQRRLGEALVLCRRH